jgi:Tol biopolymer transport system component/DNA-binding winged helix-turn-helix (wHTH) protein
MPVGEKHTFRFGPFELDTQCGQLRKDGVGLKLQGQPVQILEILLEKPGQLVTREDIRQRLWTSDTFVDFDHSLNTAVKKLRQTLGDEADTPHYIETLPKRGYRFIGAVEREEPKREEPKVATLDPPPVAVVAAERIELPQHVKGKRPLRRRSIAAISAAALLAVAGYWFATPPPQPRIVNSRVLTKTGYPKRANLPLLVDRGSLYFSELRPSGVVYQQVPVTGGEASSVLRPNVFLSDISRDGSEMLWWVDTDPASMKSDTWVQPVPNGTPRLIVKDARWAIWSADGHSIFFTRNHDKELYRANVDGTGVERLATVPAFGNSRLSPDGSRIRFTGDFPGAFPEFPLWEVGADGSNPHHILSGYQDVWGGSWSADGKYYFFTAWDGDRSSLWAVSEADHWWKKANESPPQQLTFGPMSIGSPAISNDGKQLYAVGTERRGELSAYDSKSGKFRQYLGGESICMVDFSRDGQWIAYVTYPEGTLWRGRIDGSERRQLTVPPLAVINPRWSPDGKMIVFSDASNGDRRKMTYLGPGRIYAVSADGGGPVLLLAGYVGDSSWSPDGRSIAYGTFASSAFEVRVLDLQSQKSTTVPGSQGVWSPRWSPDGKYLAAIGGQWRKLMLFSFASHAWVELDSTRDWGFGWPCWSRDSKFVYVQDGDSLVRIAIADHKKEQIVSLAGFRATSYYFDRIGYCWFGLTPDGRPLTTRDTGIQEIYAFDLEYK